MSPIDATRKREERSSRFESVSLVYLAFFVLAVLTPSIISHDYLGLPQMYWEEILIFFTGLGSLVTFSVYERLMEKRTQERDAATQSAERAKKELVESYKYIGSVNRQIEVLKKLANETSTKLTKSNVYWKDLLQSLASNAATSAGADRVLIRFVELNKLRTDREVMHAIGRVKQIKFANRELKAMHDSGASHAFVKSEDGTDILVIPSEKRDSDIKAYLLIAGSQNTVSDIEISLLKVFANQAELVYHNLIREKQPNSAMSVVEAMTSGNVEEIS